MSETDKPPFIDRVDKITKATQPSRLSSHKQDACDTIKEYEKEIDQLVYKLYDLAEDEIRIIEGN